MDGIQMETYDEEETFANPCPFCGGIDLDWEENDPRHWKADWYRVRVSCQGCGAAGPWDKTGAGAAYRWSERS